MERELYEDKGKQVIALKLLQNSLFENKSAPLLVMDGVSLLFKKFR